jgi:hypothetical protein
MIFSFHPDFGFDPHSGPEQDVSLLAAVGADKIRQLLHGSYLPNFSWPIGRATVMKAVFFDLNNRCFSVSAPIPHRMRKSPSGTRTHSAI